MTQNRHRDEDLKAPFVLALDVGTTSTRALLFDARGSAVPGVVSQIKYGLTTSHEGEVSVDAATLLDAVERTIDEALKMAGLRAKQIKAVATDTFWHSLLGVDNANQPLTPVITWEDTRSQGAALELREKLDELAIHQRTGARFHACYWTAKLRWLAEERNDIFARTAQWISFGEYLHRCFLGQSVCSLSMASATGLLRTREQRWDEELLRALGVQPQTLPRLGDVGDGIQGMKEEYKQRWPELQDAIWFPALGDGATANIGSGCATVDRWALTIGTSAAARVIVPCGEIVPPDGLWLYLVDAKRAVLGGALSEGGNLLAWLAQMFKVASMDDIEVMVASVKPDEHGLTILPFIGGERSVGWHAEARMTISGISLHTSQAMLLRASMEALAYRLLAVYERLQGALKLRETPEVVGSGGTLLNSGALRQIIADAWGVTLYSSHVHEASARGAALLALEALGVIANAADVPSSAAQATYPDEVRGKIYRGAAQRQQDLYRKLLA